MTSTGPPPIPQKPARHLPGFAGVFLGAWLMTRRTQLGMRKLPWQLGMLLVIPIVMFFTVSSPQSWQSSHANISDPEEVANHLSHRLRHSKTPLSDDTRQKLEEMLRTETTRSEKSWIEDPTRSPDGRRKRVEEHLNEWNSRILANAKTLLSELEYNQFRDIQSDNRDNAFRNMTEVSVPWSRERPFYEWLVHFYFYLILPLMCVGAAGPLIRDELQADTLGFLVTRPVGRARLIIAKYLAQVIWTECVMALELALVIGAGKLRHIPDIGSLFALAFAIQVLAVPAFCGLGLLLGQLTARYMAFALLYGSVVEVGIGMIPTNINTISLFRQLNTLLSHSDTLLNVFAWTEGSTAKAICVLALAPVVYVSVAAALFTYREYNVGGGDMQK